MDAINKKLMGEKGNEWVITATHNSKAVATILMNLSVFCNLNTLVMDDFSAFENKDFDKLRVQMSVVNKPDPKILAKMNEIPHIVVLQF